MSIHVDHTIRVNVGGDVIAITKEEAIELRDVLIEAFPLRPMINYRDWFPNMNFPPVTSNPRPYSPVDPNQRFGPALTGDPLYGDDVCTTSEEKPTPSSGISITTREVSTPTTKCYLKTKSPF